MRRLIYYMTILVLLGSSAAFAGDGKIEISQSMVPYTVSAGGSYIVTENLSVTNGSTGIVVNADNVTIDLNGFTIAGPGKGVGTVSVGIKALRRISLKVVNGMVSDMRRSAVDLEGCTNATISYVQASDCGLYGIRLASGLVDHSTCTKNGTGIWLDSGVVIYNTCNDNVDFGIQVDASGMIKNNSCRGNGLDGIFVKRGCHVENNQCTDNGWNSFGWAAGISTEESGNNICGNTVQGNPYPIAMWNFGTPSTNFCGRNLGSRNNNSGIYSDPGAVVVTGVYGNVNILLD